MTTIDLDALDALARNATPGPWSHDPEDGRVDRLEDDEGEIVVAGQVIGTFWPHGGPTRQLLLESADAEYIAAADPSTVLALIADLRRAQETVDQIEDFVTRHYLDTQMGRRVLALIDPDFYDEGNPE